MSVFFLLLVYKAHSKRRQTSLAITVHPARCTSASLRSPNRPQAGTNLALPKPSNVSLGCIYCIPTSAWVERQPTLQTPGLSILVQRQQLKRSVCLPGKLQLAICCISAAAGCLYNSTRKENPDTPASTQTFTYLPYLAIKATNQRQGLGGLAIKAMEYIILKGNTLHAFAVLEKKYCIQSGAGWNMNTRCWMVLPSVRAFWL